MRKEVWEGRCGTRKTMMASRLARAGFMSTSLIAEVMWDKWGRPTFHREPHIEPGPQANGARTVLPLIRWGRACRGPRGYYRPCGTRCTQARLPSAQGTTHAEGPLATLQASLLMRPPS